jgi:hypothetical protein
MRNVVAMAAAVIAAHGSCVAFAGSPERPSGEQHGEDRREVRISSGDPCDWNDFPSNTATGNSHDALVTCDLALKGEGQAVLEATGRIYDFFKKHDRKAMKQFSESTAQWKRFQEIHCGLLPPDPSNPAYGKHGRCVFRLYQQRRQALQALEADLKDTSAKVPAEERRKP